jgi:aminoglycoside phosphotransferase (APT) family kinase protein
MPRYYFDLHAGNLSEWDDEGMEAENTDEAVVVAKDMLVVAIADEDRLQGDRHAVVVVRDKSGNQVATATATANAAGEALVVRAVPSVSE